MAAPTATQVRPSGTNPFRRVRSWVRAVEGTYKWLFFACAVVSVVTTIGIVTILLRETVAFFSRPEVTLREFFTSTHWSPTFSDPQFGVLPLVNGTVLITGLAILLAGPLGVLTGIYLSQYASSLGRNILKPILELLAGVPTIVYGYFGLIHVTPALKTIVPDIQVFNALSGAIVVGIMILPMVTTLCDDALRAVPSTLRDGGLALGSTKFEVIRKIQFRAALSGVMAAVILAVSRAIGETMAVTLAAGQSPKLTLNPAESIQTMTAYIVQISQGDTPAGSTAYLTLYAVGFLLFVLTLGLNLVARWLVKRFAIKY